MTYPLEPLATAAGIRLGVIGGQQADGVPVGMTALADRLDVSVSTIKRLARAGLTDAQADRYAIALGHMPHQVWPDLWWQNSPESGGIWGAAARNEAKTACPRGHEYDRLDAAGKRRCSICHRAVCRRYRDRKKSSDSCQKPPYPQVETVIAYAQPSLFDGVAA